LGARGLPVMYVLYLKSCWDRIGFFGV
jgi:hypothetical protein